MKLVLTWSSAGSQSGLTLTAENSSCDKIRFVDAKKVIKQLKVEYPGKKIIADPEDNPTEIIVEIEPTKEHPERSLALAVVGRSKPHYHKESTEIYETVKGRLKLYINGKKYVLEKGEKMTIKPNRIHHTEGEEAWFLTYSNPGWAFEDHIVVKE